MKLLFKFRIALLSFAVSGILLFTFGIAVFVFIYSSGIDRIDRELRSLAEAPMRGGHPESYWRSFGNSLSFIYSDREEQIALTVLNRNGNSLFETENFPAELSRYMPEDAPEDTRHLRSHAFITRLDRNDDDKVNRKEFDGPPERFYIHDINHDGFIDEEEITQVPASAFSGRRPQPGLQRPEGQQPPLGQQPHGNRQRRPPDGSLVSGPLPIHTEHISVQIGSTQWRVATFASPEVSALMAMNMEVFNDEIRHIRMAFMIGVPTALILLGAVGWFLAGRAMKPVAAIAETAASITAKDLDKRIPKVGNDIELERLVDVSNNMLERLERSYHQAVRFSADAAHELQTPLTILQGELDNAIQSSENGSDEQQRYSMLLEETRNLKTVVQKLLLLAHADEGRLNLNRQPVNLSELIENAAEDIEFMQPELSVFADIDQSIKISADSALLNQVIRNMTSNAAKYSTAQGTVLFSLSIQGRKVCFTLSNTAPAIPTEDEKLLFDRFHRVEKSRTAAGSGLGLSLAREIARAHNGDLVLNSHKDGMVSFTLSLPIT